MRIGGFRCQREAHHLVRVRPLGTLIAGVLLLLVGLWAPGAAGALDTLNDLTELSLDQLADIQVVSVSKRTQRLSDTAAAVYVISQDDIRRSGATTIPELLGTVPGLSVARIDASKWAVSSRGFNGRFSNKVLVLIDGRSVFTPLFSGVFWELQEISLADVDRIEIIRGPGATIWGANAVNGVINIITKSARDTQGTLVSAGGGTAEQSFGSVRYGGRAWGNGFYRAYAQYSKRREADLSSGEDGKDAWEGYLAGARTDWNKKLMVQAEIKRANSGDIIEIPTLTPPYISRKAEDISTFDGYVLGKWRDQLFGASTLSLQMYYDRTEYDFSLLNTAVDTFDMEAQHQFSWGRQTMVWGMGYRFIHDDMDSDNVIFRVSNTPQTHQLFNGFIQDEVAWLDGALRLTLGSKIEHNDITGFEIEPNLRLLYAPTHRYTLWGAVSRAVGTPSIIIGDGFRLDTQALPPGAVDPTVPVPAVIQVISKGLSKAENVTAFEMGARAWPRGNISCDISLFYCLYRDLTSTTAGAAYLDTSASSPHLVIPLRVGNTEEATSYGGEVAAEWLIGENWKIKATYSFLRVRTYTTGAPTVAVGGSKYAFNSPRNQVGLGIDTRVTRNVQLDVWAKYVDTIDIQDVGSYITLDTRVGWQITPAVSVSLVARNLLDPGHLEDRSEFIMSLPTEAERSVYAKLTWQF